MKEPVIVEGRCLRTAVAALRIRQMQLRKYDPEDPYGNLLNLELVDEAIVKLQKNLENAFDGNWREEWED